jgi:hypothetical protein
MLRFSQKIYPKLPVLIAVLLASSWLFANFRIHHTLQSAWLTFKIPAMAEPFRDARMVTYPIDCVVQGLNPYDRNSCYRLDSVYNYPRVWLDLRYFGVSSKSSVAFGLALVCMFIASLFALFTARNWLSAAIILFSILSRPVFFAIERGNTDLAIFSLLVFGFLVIGSQAESRKSWLTSGWIAVLTALKIYPIAAVILFLKNRRGLLPALWSSALAIFLLLLTSGRNVIDALRNTPQRDYWSFGSVPVFLRFTSHLPHLHAIFERHHATASVVALVVFAASVYAANSHKDAVSKVLPQIDFETALGRIAISCLAIFCLNFIAGAAFGYRLIFLLGALAYLVDLNNRWDRRALPVSMLLIAIMWMPLMPQHQLRAQILDVIGFLFASMWLGVSIFCDQTHAHICPEENEKHPLSGSAKQEAGSLSGRISYSPPVRLNSGIDASYRAIDLPTLV